MNEMKQNKLVKKGCSALGGGGSNLYARSRRLGSALGGGGLKSCVRTRLGGGQAKVCLALGLELRRRRFRACLAQDGKSLASATSLKPLNAFRWFRYRVHLGVVRLVEMNIRRIAMIQRNCKHKCSATACKGRESALPARVLQLLWGHRPVLQVGLFSGVCSPRASTTDKTRNEKLW